jgi:hypothetical protein
MRFIVTDAGAGDIDVGGYVNPPPHHGIDHGINHGIVASWHHGIMVSM